MQRTDLNEYLIMIRSINSWKGAQHEELELIGQLILGMLKSLKIKSLSYLAAMFTVHSIRILSSCKEEDEGNAT